LTAFEFGLLNVSEAEVTRTDANLGDLIGQQLGRLSSWAGLPGGIAADLSGALELFAADALARSARGPFDGLSFINASGLPVQWSFSAPGERGVRVLCEAGVPATSTKERAQESLDRLRAIVGRLGWSLPAWLDDVVSIVMPESGGPGHWRSAIWLGLGASTRGLALKPYFNLNRDAPRDRWIRIGQVLVALGRPAAAARLCEMATSSSKDSWPVGLAFDLLPDGNPGRVKAYFRSAAVDREWLFRWLSAADGAMHRQVLTRVLDALDAPNGYPGRAFVVSPEFHPDQRVSFKVDLAVTRWIAESRAVGDGLATLGSGLGLDISSVGEGIGALEGFGLETEPKYRFIGWGIEPDGRTHLNTYVEPPLPVSPPAARPRNRARIDPVRRAVALGSGALSELQRDGHWEDYRLPVGASDSWVTAFVLYWSGLPARWSKRSIGSSPPGHRARAGALDVRSRTTPIPRPWPSSLCVGRDARSHGMHRLSCEPASFHPAELRPSR
jgi:hypothetical protein